MAEVISLRAFRKARERTDKAREAEANRAKFGRTRAEKAARKAEQERAARALDGAKLEPED